jgi:hypothetical protein
MDFLESEANKLKQLVTSWYEHDDYELEATFGAKGTVDATAFFAIAQRLKAKGYEPGKQEDRLNIILPERIRLTLVGSGLIQQYCRDDTINNKPFIAIIKDRTFIESNLDLDDYDTRIKVRREVELSRDDARLQEIIERWSVHRKAFRLIRRWSFEGKGVAFDLSIVRQTRYDARGSDYQWARTFTERNFMADPVSYEVEVELKRSAPGVSVDQAMKDLIRGIGEVLRGIQKNSLIMRRRYKERALAGYKQLVGADTFRGVAPVTLEKENMTSTIDEKVPNIRNGYNVTDKADGLRVMAYVDRRGELFMIDMGMNVYRTGLKNESCRDSLLDGEWVTKDKDSNGINQLMLFDCYIAPGAKVVDEYPFAGVGAEDESAAGRSRYQEMVNWIAAWNTETQIIAPGINDANKLMVSHKKFSFAAPGRGIFKAAAKIMDKARHYPTDGLIFTPNELPLPKKSGGTFWEQFKWKPAEDNTIDFLVNFEKDVEAIDTDKVTIGVNPDTNETIRYKTVRLYVGSQKTAVEQDPRTAVLFGEEQARSKAPQKRNYEAVLFNPREYPDTMAATCYRSAELDLETGDEYIITEGTKEPIRDRSIVEMAYDPSREPGWRWVPLRVRHDKTERFSRGILGRSLNNEKVAEAVWNSIHNPVTMNMIRTGSEEALEEEIQTIKATRAEVEDVARTYYERKAPKKDMLLVAGLREFHNSYIKEDILYKVALRGGSKRLLDVACGMAGDLQKWRRGNVAFAFGIDYAGNNIRDPDNGAYRRYADTIQNAKKRGQTVPPMLFAIGDCSQRLIDGTAGATPEERDIMRSVFGKVRPEGAIPPYLERVAAGSLAGGADAVSCMFAVHYFFEDRTKLDGFVNNINETLKVGGYFIGCAFDGAAVFKLLKKLSEGQSKVGKVGDTPIWTIMKSYDADEFLADDSSLGMAIDVDFISIGSVQREYLVNFDLLKERMAGIGCELLTDVEAREFGLATGTNTFDASYDMATKGKRKFPMEESVKQFSFMNRWFIFKRRGNAPIAEVPTGLATTKSKRRLAAESLTDAVTGTVERAPGSAIPLTEESGSAAPVIVRRRKNKTALADAGDVGTGGPGGPGADGIRTVPVTMGPAQALQIEPARIFQIYMDASDKDTLAIKEPGAGRYLSLAAPVAIPDPDDPKVKYPTVEHYIAGMKYKLATNKPELAVLQMSQEGKIHQDFLAQRLAETAAGSRALSSSRDKELLKEEAELVRLKSRPQAMASFGAMYDDSKWVAAKDDVLRRALEWRWTHDRRTRKILEAARDANKYLLYYTTASGSELGGKRRTDDGTIDGSNKVGKIYMELAGFPPF